MPRLQNLRRHSLSGGSYHRNLLCLYRIIKQINSATDPCFSFPVSKLPLLQFMALLPLNLDSHNSPLSGFPQSLASPLSSSCHMLLLQLLFQIFTPSTACPCVKPRDFPVHTENASCPYCSLPFSASLSPSLLSHSLHSSLLPERVF